MMQAAESLADLYEADEVAWLETMADLIAEGKHADLDFDHLQEILTDMALRERHEVESRLVVLIAHLLKWTYQKKKRTRSWRTTIFLQSDRLSRTLRNKTLRNHAAEVLANVYKSAVKAASMDTGLPASAFPKKCPWTLPMLLSEDPLKYNGRKTKEDDNEH
ncbi:MAG: DUF29 domain-containing protein [Gemmataceae bacterium]|nr:DUF29 domain-containing protein [Gemmataceae bacterium]